MHSFEEIEKIYTDAMKIDEGDGENFKPYYDKNNPCGYNLNQNGEFILNTVKQLVPKEHLILEIGGCTGKLAFKIAEAGYNITSMDCVSEAIILANKYKLDFSKEIQDKASFEHGFIERLGYKDDQFNCIIISEVLEHLEDLEIGVKEMFRVLKRNGLLVFTIPFKDRVKSRQHLHIHSFDMESIIKVLKPYIRFISILFHYDNKLKTYSNIYGTARKGIPSLIGG